MKRKTLHPVYYSILIVFLAGCHYSSAPDKTVLLEPTRNGTLELGSPWRIIKLETSAESNLGYISKTETDFTNDRIFVLSEFNIFIFNGNGKFIAKLNKGNGPGEVSMITAFSINRHKNVLYALDNSRLILKYDYNGNFIDDSPIKDFYAIDIQSVDNDNVLLQNLRVNEREPWFVVNYNLTKNEITGRFISIEKSLYPDFFMITGNSFHRSDRAYSFSCTNIFSLFEWKKDSLLETISYDLKERSVPESLISDTRKNKRRVHFGEDARIKGYVPYLFGSFYFNNYIFAILDDEQKTCYAISRTNRNLVFNKGTVASYFGLPDNESFSDPKEVGEDYLVFAAMPTDFFAEESQDNSTTVEIGKQKLEVELEENPFLVIVNRK